MNNGNHAQAADGDDEGQTVVLTMTLNVLDEDLLRRTAAERMVESGYGGKVEDHMSLPLDRLAYEAIFASNPDPMSSIQMGFEVICTSTD